MCILFMSSNYFPTILCVVVLANEAVAVLQVAVIFGTLFAPLISAAQGNGTMFVISIKCGRGASVAIRSATLSRRAISLFAVYAISQRAAARGDKRDKPHKGLAGLKLADI